jgi:hypothetical protein
MGFFSVVEKRVGKKSIPCLTAQKGQGCFEIFRTIRIKEEYIKG